MKDKTKNIIITGLIVVIVCGGFFSWNNQNRYKKIINTNIYTNLSQIEYTLKHINEELQDENIGAEEFQDLFFKYYMNIYMNINSNYKCKYLKSNLEYLNMFELESYIASLMSTKNLSEKEIEYHKRNIQKIYGLTQNMEIHLTYNFFKPKEQLTETIKEINNLSEKGSKHLSEEEG